MYRKAIEKIGQKTSLQAIVETLYENFPHYSWVGVYRVEDDELVLEAWRGPFPTQHVRIPIGKGICGSAAKTGRTEVVPNVSNDSRYLACFTSTRSEIVVPIKKGRKVVGEIDIDSDKRDAFSEADRIFLERVASIIAQNWKSLTKSSNMASGGVHGGE